MLQGSGFRASNLSTEAHRAFWNQALGLVTMIWDAESLNPKPLVREP